MSEAFARAKAFREVAANINALWAKLGTRSSIVAYLIECAEEEEAKILPTDLASAMAAKYHVIDVRQVRTGDFVIWNSTRVLREVTSNDEFRMCISARSGPLRKSGDGPVRISHWNCVAHALRRPRVSLDDVPRRLRPNQMMLGIQALRDPKFVSATTVAGERAFVMDNGDILTLREDHPYLNGVRVDAFIPQLIKP